MAVAIRIPKLGMSMLEATLIDWLVGDGESIAEGETLYVLETDKVETEVDAPASGILRQAGTPGEIYQVGEVIGEIETAQ